MKLNSHNEWDKLKEVIVGSAKNSSAASPDKRTLPPTALHFSAKKDSTISLGTEIGSFLSSFMFMNLSKNSSLSTLNVFISLDDNLLAKSKDLPKEKDLDSNSPMEKKALDWITDCEFYKNNFENIELKAQFKIGEYIKQLAPNYSHPKYKVDFFLIYNNGEKSSNVVIEYDGLEHHFKNINQINEFNFEENYSEEHYERQKILESYGYKFIRLNRFNCAQDPSAYINQKLEDIFKVKKKI